MLLRRIGNILSLEGKEWQGAGRSKAEVGGVGDVIEVDDKNKLAFLNVLEVESLPPLPPTRLPSPFQHSSS